MYTQPDIKMALPGPKAKEIIARDHAVMSTSMTPRGNSFVISHGDGVWLYDVDGNRYMDLMAGIAVSATGYNHPAVSKAIKEQVDQYLHICSAVFYTPIQVSYAERITRLAKIKGNGKNRVFFANSGAEAWDGAMKLARYKTGRQNIICFYGAFHGRTFGGIGSNASKVIQRRGFGPHLPSIYHAFYPHSYVCPHDSEVPHTTEGCIKYIKDYLFSKMVAPDEVAAIALEPIQGEGGYVVPPKEFIQAIRKLCDDYGILLIADEVQSGFGRTGKLFCMEHYDVQPDIICMAKGIASGMPLSGFMANEAVMDWPKGAHGSTFGGSPTAFAAALVTLDLLENGLMANAEKVGNAMLARLKPMVEKYTMIGDVRGMGMMIGLEIVSNKPHVQPDEKMRDKILDACFHKGLLMLGCGSHAIRFCPPLILTEEQAMAALDIFDDVLKTL